MLPHEHDSHESDLVSILLSMNILNSSPVSTGAVGELDSSFSAFNDHEGTTVSSKSVPMNANLE